LADQSIDPHAISGFSVLCKWTLDCEFMSLYDLNKCCTLIQVTQQIFITAIS